MDGDGNVDATPSKEPRTSALWIHRDGRERERERDAAVGVRRPAAIATVGNFDLENSLRFVVLSLGATQFSLPHEQPESTDFFDTPKSSPSPDALNYRSQVLISNKLILQFLGNDQFLREEKGKLRNKEEDAVVVVASSIIASFPLLPTVVFFSFVLFARRKSQLQS